MSAPRPVVRWTDLGRRDYAETWDLQRRLVASRKAGAGVDRLLLVEHPPVITLGRRADPRHVLAAPEALAARGIARHDVERAGDVTYHGPGQLVAYPILDLAAHRKDVRWYAEGLLETARRVAAAHGVVAHARGGRETGVWLGAPGAGGRDKIAALGVRIERWVTYHGLALNVDPDLSAFDLIVPCGLAHARAASLAEALGRPLGLAAVRPVFLAAFADVFGVDLLPDAAGLHVTRPDDPPAPEDGDR